ncbi:uroporphyrinogen-III synthase [Ancylobacter dichloromethanicus]
MRVLVTRPQPDAQATAARLRQAGHAVMVDPMLAVEALPEARLPAGGFDAVALTSVNGARLLGARVELSALASLPLYAVGRRTAAAAPRAFAEVHIAGGDGAALADLLRTRLPPGGAAALCRGRGAGGGPRGGAGGGRHFHRTFRDLPGRSGCRAGAGNRGGGAGAAD